MWGLAAVIVALLIIGGLIYSYSGTATHVASNTAPVPAATNNGPAHTAPALAMAPGSTTAPTAPNHP